LSVWNYFLYLSDYYWGSWQQLMGSRNVPRLFRNTSKQAKAVVSADSLSSTTFATHAPVVLYLRQSRQVITLTQDPERMVKAEMKVYGEDMNMTEELNTFPISELQRKVASWKTEPDPSTALKVTSCFGHTLLLHPSVIHPQKIIGLLHHAVARSLS